MSDQLVALVVEDGRTMAAKFSDMLVQEGVEVLPICATEDQALTMVEKHRIDFALIDLQLAQGTGFGVIRRLRNSTQNLTTAIVVITNHAVPALKVCAFEAGADYFLDKAKDIGLIPRLVRELMGKKEKA